MRGAGISVTLEEAQDGQVVQGVAGGVDWEVLSFVANHVSVLHKVVSKPPLGLPDGEKAASGTANTKDHISGCAVEVCCLLLVALLWGGTNPFLKKGTEGIEKVKSRNIVIQLFAEIKFLFLNYKYLVPFLLNQSGSVIYYYTLATTVSEAFPVPREKAMVSGIVTGQVIQRPRSVTGCAFIKLTDISLHFTDWKVAW
ncbi:transmembrane protein 234 isoform X2 [Rhincodon typus]|uniref:transmembrane protein 234 isoform X2 n=1 Tax=Rhincodon typus TaxID=259920 RepID=UPI00202DDAEB|nr:transmembrane protein 234 isoform X2 [Rhincodon typus]